jgi:hypothetical protein
MARLFLRALLPLVASAALIVGLAPAASALTPAPSAITLTGPSTATRAEPLTLTGKLTSGGLPLFNAEIDVFRTDMDVSQQPLTPVHTQGTTGNFSVQDTPLVGGPVVYTVTYAGDALHQAASTSLRVTVSRNVTSLSIHTDRHNYAYNASVLVTVHLGPTYTNRQVFILARPIGGSAHAIGGDLVDAHGNLTAVATVKVKTFFSVKFDGDEQWLPATASTRVGVHAKVDTTVSHIKRTDGRYRVYSARNGGGLAIKVMPNKAGERITFVLQARRGSGWHDVFTLVRHLRATSTYHVFFFGNPGHHYRIRGQYGGDAANLPQIGAWQYAEFV